MPAPAMTKSARRRQRRRFAEETAHFAEIAAGKLPPPDMRPIRSTRGRPAGMTGIDWSQRDGFSVARGHRPPGEDVGCTIGALDYRDSRARRNAKGGTSMRETKTGSRSLPIA